MRRVLLCVAACALGLVLTGTATAHDHARPARAPSYATHGVRFSGGYYYTARHHPNWERRVWVAESRRYHYYDPSLRYWYYWVPARQCYYPVGYVCD